MTTKLDLLRDCLIDLLINFRFDTNGGDYKEPERVAMPEWMRTDIVESMLELVSEHVFDDRADKQDFTVKVSVNKTVDTPFGDIIPEENTKQSEVL